MVQSSTHGRQGISTIIQAALIVVALFLAIFSELPGIFRFILMYTALGDMPESKPVFDLDSATLVQLVREMVDKGSINGNQIEAPPTLHVGAAANPNAEPMGPEVLKIRTIFARILCWSS